MQAGMVPAVTAAPRLARIGQLSFAVCAVAWSALRIPFAAGPARAAVEHAVDELALVKDSEEHRVAAAVGLLPDDAALLRRYFASDGRVVVFCASDRIAEVLQKDMPVRVEMIATGVRNALYPHPRDCRFATTADGLRQALDAALIGRLLVIDLTPTREPLPVPGRFELLHERGNETVRIRFWSLVQYP